MDIIVNHKLLKKFTSPPYTTKWNTDSVSTGDHIITAIARDENGNQIAESEERKVNVYLSTGGSPDEGKDPGPTNLVASEISVISFELNWDAVPNATSYKLYQATTPPQLFVDNIQTTNFSVTGLGPNITVGAYVTAVVNGKETTPSNTAIVTTLTPKFSFTSNRDGNEEVYIMDINGTNQSNISNNGSDDNMARWSHDQRFLVFVSNRDGNMNIYKMRRDGSEQEPLTTHAADDFTPAFSKDGTKIVFTSTRDGNQEIYSMNSDGTNLTRLTTNGADDYAPSWNSDATKIAFVSTRDGNEEIYVMNADGSNKTNLTNNPANDEFPRFNTDDSKILFTSNRLLNENIHFMNADGSGVTSVTLNPASETFSSWLIGDPVGKLLFDTNRDGNREIYVVNQDMSNLNRLTNNGATDEYPSASYN